MPLEDLEILRIWALNEIEKYVIEAWIQAFT